MNHRSIRIETALLFASLLLSLIYHFAALKQLLQLMPTDGHSLGRQFDRQFLAPSLGFFSYLGMWILGAAGMVLAVISLFKRRAFPIGALLLAIAILLSNIGYHVLQDRIFQVAAELQSPDI